MVARIELWNGDICDLEVDVIVNAASTALWMSTGVGGALKRRGGDAIEFAAVRQGPVPIGSAVVTTAGALAAQAVIHAVSLDTNRRTSAPAIAQAVRSALDRVRELEATSVAFPALGTGVGGFPIDEAALVTARVALQCHGAIGYTTEYDLHLYMKRAWALARSMGDGRLHRSRVAAAIL